MNKILLQCDNLCKRYQEGTVQTDVLHDVSFSIEEGEMMAIVGTSGSGKSTLLHLLGGLDTPRSPAEIQGGDGFDVLCGKAKVVNKAGEDVTAQYVKGAEIVLELCKKYGVTEAVLKEKSPSCGCGRIYDGTFTGTLTDGDGVTAALMKENGIKVYGESELEKLL